jgi:hypothetical protein
VSAADRGAGDRLPVDPERLRREFPSLTAQDLEAYVEVTRRILASPPERRAGVTRDALAGGRRARERAARGESLDAEDGLLSRYLDAMGKMQGKGPA